MQNATDCKLISSCKQGTVATDPSFNVTLPHWHDMTKVFLKMCTTEKCYRSILRSNMTDVTACSQMHFTVQSCLGSCSSASQETTCILWNLKVRPCVHNSPALVRILNETTSNNNLPPSFSKVYCNTVFHLCLCFTSGLVSSGFPTKIYLFFHAN